MPFDKTKFYLGRLCKRKHEYKNSGQSLRYKNSNCIECKKIFNTKYEYRQEYYHEYYKKHKNKYQEYYIQNIERIKTYRKQYHKEYYAKNKERIKKAGKKYRKDNKEKVKQCAKKYYNSKESKNIIKKWKEKNRDKIRKTANKYNRKQIKTLGNSYIKRNLIQTHGFKPDEISDNIIELKRLSMLTDRIYNLQPKEH